MSTQMSGRLAVLRKAPLNSWVALSEDESRIVAVGANYREVVMKSDAAGEEDAIILKTPSMWAPLFV
jgi:hypothetical protein